ncbi:MULTISPECIES: hypothetical protein [unclassified Nocardioides]|uniref:hypothetical protein n=1 Tax=unclassified Nocardioides TaxID=2615069 RepID=UPI000A267AFF|nr:MULTISPECIES: hypothetical protein [unclassified Nocardioides]
MATRARSGEYVEVEEAARLLGVTTRQVARLGSAGEVSYVGRGLVERASLAAYLRERGFSRTRAWDEVTAWAAVALLSGLEVDWLGQVQTSRLRSRLRQLAESETGAHELVGRARNRAATRTYEYYDFLAPRMRKDMVVVSRRGLGLADARKDQVDGYIAADELDELEKRYGLRRSARGTMTLRSTHFDTNGIKRIATQGNGALAALDAAGSLDAREHDVGARALTDHLEEFARGRARA